MLQHLQRRLAPANAPSLSNSLVSFVVASLLVGVPLYLIDYQGLVSVWLLLILALSVLIAHRHSRNSRAAAPLCFIICGFTHRLQPNENRVHNAVNH